MKKKLIVILLICFVVCVLGIGIYLFVSKPFSDKPVSVDDISGEWTIGYARHSGTGEDIPLTELYGSGIKYGGILTVNEDGTFSRYIGITTAETAQYEGTYRFGPQVIIFEYHDGTVATAEYLPKTDEIVYRINEYIDEYYIKS